MHNADIETLDLKFQDLNTKQLIELTPSQLTKYLGRLDEQGELESFIDKAIKDDQLISLLSYWEKWFPEPTRRLIDTKVKEARKKLSERTDCLPLDLESKFTERELAAIFARIGWLQLTFGCSKACKYCGLDATPKVRDEIPFEQLENLFKKYGYGIGKSRWFLYYASEPSDYEKYTEAHKLAVKHGNYHPHITTHEIDDPDWINFIKENIGSWIRISIHAEDPRFQEIIKDTADRSKVIIDGTERDISLKRAGLISISTNRDDHDKNLGCNGIPNPENKNKGLGENDTVVITPRGIYNTISRPVSEQYPQGHIVIPLSTISNEPIEVGQSLYEIMSSSIILFGPQRYVYPLHSGDIYTVYRKSGIYQIHFSCDKVVDVKELNKDLPLGVKELEKYYEEKKLEAINTAEIEIKGNIDADLRSIALRNLSKLKSIEFEERIDDLYKLHRSIIWTCQLDPSDNPELSEPVSITLDYYPEENRASMSCRPDSMYNGPIYENYRIVTEEQLEPAIKLVKKAIEEGEFEVNSKHIINLQELADFLNHADFSDLKIKGIRPYKRRPTEIAKWEWNFAFTNSKGEKVNCELKVEQNIPKQTVEVKVNIK